MFEKKHEKLAPLSKFVRRMVLSVGMAGILMTLALSIGILGYHGLVGFDWVDSLLEVCSGQVFSDTGIGCFSAIFRS